MGQCQHVERVQPAFEEEVKKLTGRAKARTFPLIGGAAQVGNHSGGTCAFFLEQVTNVPSSDSQPGMCSGVSRHPSVVVWAEVSGKPLGQVAEWPSKTCLQPAWFSARSLGFQLGADAASAVLRVELRDASSVLASLQLPMKDLLLHERLAKPLDTTQPGARPVVSFQILDSKVVLRPRTVYLVRHGESQWNKAQGKLDIHGMVRTTDHSLSSKGREQAETLGRLMQAELNKDGGGTLRETANANVAPMLRPDIIMASPLGRALQTAVIAYGPILAKTSEQHQHELILAPNAKEKQNLGGLDTHCTKIGQEILQGCQEELQNLYAGSGKEKIIDAVFEHFQYDLEEVNARWWPEGQSESTKQLHGRLEEFMYQLLFASHESIVVFGHSLFFQQLMRKYFNESYKQNELAQKLSFGKLPNCGVVRLELDPSKMLDGPFLKAELVLGTELSGEGGNCSLTCCASGHDTANELRADEILAMPVESTIANLPGDPASEAAEAEKLEEKAEAPPPPASPTSPPVEPTKLEPHQSEPAKLDTVEGKADKKGKQIKKCCPL